MKLLSMVDNFKAVVMLIKFLKNGTMHICSTEIRRRKVLKIYFINDLFSLFSY